MDALNAADRANANDRQAITRYGLGIGEREIFDAIFAGVADALDGFYQCVSHCEDGMEAIEEAGKAYSAANEHIQNSIETIATEEFIDLYTDRTAYTLARQMTGGAVGAVLSRTKLGKAGGLPAEISFSAMSIVGSIGKAAADARNNGGSLSLEDAINIISRGGYHHDLF